MADFRKYCMNRAKLNYWIDVGLLISFLIVAVTGILKFGVLTDLFGMRRRVLPIAQMSVLHDWAGIVLVVLVLVHLILHWNWMVAMTKNMFKKDKKEEEK